MTSERRIQGLSLKVGPLGEYDRLLTILSDEEGICRFAVPGARRPKSKLAASVPLTLLDLQVGGKSNLKKVRQLQVIHNYSKVGEHLETLAAAQFLAEICMLLAARNTPQPGILSTMLIHLERLETAKLNFNEDSTVVLAKSIQACVHLLAIGGYGLPVQTCCRSGIPLNPPLGNWEWKCSLLPEEGFAIGSIKAAKIHLNPSELALLQRLFRPHLPKRQNGKLMGPKEVWLRLLLVLEYWMDQHLSKKIHTIKILREINLNLTTKSKSL